MAREERPSANLSVRAAVLTGLCIGVFGAVWWYVAFAVLFDEHSRGSAVVFGALSATMYLPTLLILRRRARPSSVDP